MDAIAKIETKLVEFSDARYSVTKNSIEVYPEDDTGFSVSMKMEEGRYTVAFGGWSDCFSDEDDALECFGFGLSDVCQLTAVYCGEKLANWIVHFLEDGEWVEGGETGLMIPLWMAAINHPRREIHFRNHMLTIDSHGCFSIS